MPQKRKPREIKWGMVIDIPRCIGCHTCTREVEQGGDLDTHAFANSQIRFPIYPDPVNATLLAKVDNYRLALKNYKYDLDMGIFMVLMSSY